MLTETSIRAARPRAKPYKLTDERGLCLLVQPNGARLWRLRATRNGKETMLSLGRYPEIPLKMARERREEVRAKLARGIDPVAERRSERNARGDSFRSIATEWLEMRREKLAPSSWSKARWMLIDLLCPHIGSKPVSLIAPSEVLSALRRIESRGRLETAHRTKQRASAVFRYAVATGRAERDPTVDLRGALAPVVSSKRAAITSPKRIAERTSPSSALLQLTRQQNSATCPPLLGATLNQYCRTSPFLEIGIDASECDER